MTNSFSEQILRLRNAGYPTHVLVNVAEGLLKRKSPQITNATHSSTNHNKVAVIPYIHVISHRLKRIGQWANVKVCVFSPLLINCNLCAG